MTQALKYILFDHDGVLVETEQWYFESTRMALAEIEVELSLEYYMDHMVTGISSWRLAKSLGHDDEIINRQKARRDDLYQQFLMEKDLQIDGVAETLSTLSKNFKMSIVTTSKPQDFALIHRDKSIVDYMEFVLALGDYPRAKPEPDPYLAALEKFNASPEEAVVIEDSVRGLRSAIAAKIPCIVIKNAFTQSQNFSGATVILDSIKELPGYLSA